MVELLNAGDMRHKMEVDLMTKEMNIWGRDFELEVVFDVYKGEEILGIQKDALDKFIESAEDVLSDCSAIEKYCLEKNGEEIGDSVSNIFKYVIPTALFVKRDEKRRIIDLLCNYRFDEEHGIAIVYENEELTAIVSQDDI